MAAHNAAVPEDDAANATRVVLTALGWRPASWAGRQRAVTANEIPDLEGDDDRLPHDDAFCSLYEVYAESGRAFGEAMAARKLPAGGIPFRFADPDPYGTLLPDLQRLREGFHLFSEYAIVEAYLGRGGEAVRAADACLHLAQVSLATEPLLISQLVRMAGCSIAARSVERTLAWTEPADGLAGLQAACERAAAHDGMTPGVRGERAAVMRIYDNVRAGALPADYFDSPPFGASPPPSPADRLKRRLGRRDVTRDQAEVLRIDNEFLDALRLTGPARRAACDAVVARASPKATKLLPGVVKCVHGDDRCRAKLLCASAALACERHRRQTGRFPATLADIPTSILPAVPVDPFSGRPLGYRVLPDGAVVYSVGPDGKHRGTPDDATAAVNSRIYGFRLWNADARRRQPLPRPEPPEAPDDSVPGVP